MSVMEQQPASTRRSYTDEYKRDAVAMVLDDGYKIVDVARRLSINAGTAFHDWRCKQQAPPSPQELEEARLVEEIRRIHTESDSTYGEPRITPELRDRGWDVNHKKVERLMRLHGIVGIHKPAKVRTTIPAEDAPPVPDLVERRFAPGVPDVAWIGDITYIPTGEGWLYLLSTQARSYRTIYNSVRPHEAIAMARPLDRYRQNPNP